MLNFHNIKKSLQASVWFVFLTFPIMVIRVNTVEDVVEWRWRNMIIVAVAVFVLSYAWRFYLKRKESGPGKEEIKEIIKPDLLQRFFANRKYSIPASAVIIIFTSCLSRFFFPRTRQTS